MIPLHSFFHDFKGMIESSEGYEKDRFVNIFWQKVYGMRCPLILRDEVIFLCRNRFDNIYLISDLNNWQLGQTLFSRIPDTDIAYFETQLPVDACIEYKFQTGGGSFVDSLNNVKTRGTHGENSLLLMPYYKKNEETRYQETPSGRLLSIDPAESGTGKKIHVYLPFTFVPDTDYDYLIFLDGDNYLRYGNIVTILDNLIHSKKIEPCLAFFIDTGSHRTEYSFNHSIADYILSDFLPYVHEKFPVLERGNNIVVGESSAALSALQIFASCDHLNAIVQSPPVSIIRDELLDLYSRKPSTEQTLAIQCGIYETLIRGINVIDSTKELVEHIRSNGHTNLKVSYFSEGHTWNSWSNHFIDALLSMKYQI